MLIPSGNTAGCPDLSTHPHMSITDPATVTENAHMRSNSSSSCDAFNTDRGVKDQPGNNRKMSPVDFSFCLSRLTVEEDPSAGRRSGERAGRQRVSAQTVPDSSVSSRGGNNRANPPVTAPYFGPLSQQCAGIMCVTELLNLQRSAHAEGETAPLLVSVLLPSPAAGPTVDS